VLVALDSNVVDLVEVACRSSARVDAMEAMEPPPQFEDLSPQLEVEAFACHWLLAMAPAWRSTLYTFSNVLYDEVANAPHAGLLLRVAIVVLVREWQEPEFRAPDPAKRPKSAELASLGIKPAMQTMLPTPLGSDASGSSRTTSSFATSPTKFRSAGSS
jgi:hypothetical protein